MKKVFTLIIVLFVLISINLFSSEKIDGKSVDELESEYKTLIEKIHKIDSIGIKASKEYSEILIINQKIMERYNNMENTCIILEKMFNQIRQNKNLDSRVIKLQNLKLAQCKKHLRMTKLEYEYEIQYVDSIIERLAKKSMLLQSLINELYTVVKAIDDKKTVEAYNDEEIIATLSEHDKKIQYILRLKESINKNSLLIDENFKEEIYANILKNENNIKIDHMCQKKILNSDLCINLIGHNFLSFGEMIAIVDRYISSASGDNIDSFYEVKGYLEKLNQADNVNNKEPKP